MDIQKLATDLLMQQFQGKTNADAGQAQNAMQNLMGGDLNIAGLVEKFAGNSGVASQLQSWLGDGANEQISGSNIMEMLGKDSVNQFANQLGVDENTAADGLSNLIPNLIDKSSSGGSLLESVGGIGGALNVAKNLFGK